MEYRSVLAWNVKATSLYMDAIEEGQTPDQLTAYISKPQIATATLNDDVQTRSNIEKKFEYGLLRIGDVCDSHVRNSDGTPKPWNGDNVINSDDVEAINRYLAKMEVFTSAQLMTADVDFDGKVDLNDAVLLARIVAGEADTILF